MSSASFSRWAIVRHAGSSAVAGSTERAYLVEGANVSAAILAALNEIRANAQIPCQLKLPPAPPGTHLTYDAVNVGYCGPTEKSETFYRVKNEADCRVGENGWHYDNESAPKQIVLCDSACAAVSRPGGRLQLSVGCKSEEPVR